MKEIALLEEKTTILIVDDSPETIEIVNSALPKGYRRRAAVNARMALKILESDDLPDIILLDIMMPGIDGFEFCTTIKQNERLKDIPVIFLSAVNSYDNKVHAFSVGAVDYITKPFDADEIRARLNTHVKLYNLQRQLETYNRQLEQLVREKVDEITESQLATIYALAKLAESRDADTGDHIDRVAAFCRLLAEKLKDVPEYQELVTDEFIDNIFKASPLHDIGKVGIDDAILRKQGTLTEKEFEIMKSHTEIGNNTLKEVHSRYPDNKFLEIGMEVTRYHHEKWDGSGYPKGLKGCDIPLPARIMAVADNYDALRSKRPYKEAFSHEKAVSIMSRQSGIHFDPNIFQVFIEHQHLFKEIFESSN